MQKAVALTPPALRALSRLPEGFDAVYLGSEACPHLLPGLPDIRRALKLGAPRVVIVSPILTDARLPVLAALVSGALKLSAGTEVSVNDIGTVRCLSRKFGSRLKISLGRQLSRAFLKMSLPFLRSLRERFGVAFFETDSASTASAFLRSREFPIAMHYPFRLFSLTRICPYHGRVPEACALRCGDRFVALDQGKLFIKNNSYLSRTARKPELTPDRFIITPDDAVTRGRGRK
jgi:hypothetical protein